MRGLVDEQPAAVGLVAMPAAEVVGAVGGVQHPLEDHRDHLADLPGGDDLLQGGVARAVAVVEGHQHLAAGAVDGFLDASGAGGIDGQGLLDDHVGPRVQHAHHVLGVQAVRGGDDHPVHREALDELLELLGPGRLGVGELLEAAPVVLAPRGIGVDQRDQLGDVGVGTGDRIEVHLGAVAGTDDGIAGGHEGPLSKVVRSGNGGAGPGPGSCRRNAAARAGASRQARVGLLDAGGGEALDQEPLTEQEHQEQRHQRDH